MKLAKKTVEQIKHFKNVLINERSSSEIYQKVLKKENWRPSSIDKIIKIK